MISKATLALNLAALFRERSLASAMYADPSEMADEVLKAEICEEQEGEGEDGDDTIVDVVVGTLGEIAEVDEGALKLAVACVIQRGLSALQGRVVQDERYSTTMQELTRTLTAILADGVNKRDEFTKVMADSPAWVAFSDYMREKMPVRGFDAFLADNLKAMAIQAESTYETTALLTNRGANPHKLAQDILYALAKNTSIGMEQEKSDMIDQVVAAYKATRTH